VYQPCNGWEGETKAKLESEERKSCSEVLGCSSEARGLEFDKWDARDMAEELLEGESPRSFRVTLRVCKLPQRKVTSMTCGM
jgi:hypothetical protein